MCNWCKVITRRYAAAGRVLAWNEQIFSSSERHSLCAQSGGGALDVQREAWQWTLIR